MTGTLDDLVPPINSHTLHNFLEISRLLVFEVFLFNITSLKHFLKLKILIKDINILNNY